MSDFKAKMHQIMEEMEEKGGGERGKEMEAEFLHLFNTYWVVSTSNMKCTDSLTYTIGSGNNRTR